MKRYARAVFYLLLALQALVLTSCLGIRIDAKIGSDGKVDAAIDYSVPIALVELVSSERYRQFLPLPIDKTEFSKKAAAYNAELAAWSFRSETENYIVSARLRFPSVQSFADFFNGNPASTKYTSAAGVNTLSASITMGDAQVDADLRAFLKTVFPEKTVGIRIELPKPPRTNKGFSVERNTLIFSKNSSDIFSAKEPLLLEISW